MTPSLRLCPRGSPAFSLLELLVVVGLLAALLALSLPAVNGLKGSNNLVRGGNAVANLAAYARQQAVSMGTMTALVLLTGQGSDADYRTLTVLEYAEGNGWRQATAWQELPMGILVDYSDTVRCSFLTNSPATFPFLGSQPNPPVSYKGARVTAFAARIFLPSGSLQNPESPAQIRLIEGVSQNGRLTRTGSQLDGAAANFYEVAIIGATGNIKINRQQ